MLKSHMKWKRMNRVDKSSRSHRVEIANVFYENLLRSRAFFALLKWNRYISFYKIIKDNFYDYRIKTQSRLLVKSLVYAFNRKKLVDAFVELRNRKLQKRVFSALYGKTKFRLSQKKIYLSQLSNNRYSVDFLLHIGFLIFREGYAVAQKPYLKLNFDKLLAKQKHNNARDVFTKLVKACAVSREDKIKVSGKVERIKLIHTILVKRKLFRVIGEELKIKKDILKFQKRLFLLRYYYNKFKAEKQIAKFAKSNSKFKNFVIKKTIGLLKRNAFKRRQCINSHELDSFYKYKVKKKFLKSLKINTHLSSAHQYIIKQRMFYCKLNFFKTMRILMIESLLTQGLVNKITDHRRKETLGVMLKICLYQKKLCLFSRKRNKALKRKAFYFLKNLRGIINEQITRYIRFIFCMFTKLALYRNKIRKEFKAITQKKTISLYYKLFLARVKKRRNLSISEINQSKRSVPDNLRLYFGLFLNRVKAVIARKRITLVNHRYLNLKSFLYKVNKRIQSNYLKKAARRFILLKNAKILLYRVTKSLEKNYRYNKLMRLAKSHYCDKLYQSLEYCYKTKHLEDQIDLYYILKVKKKALYAMKHNFSSRLKYHLIERRFKDYLIITALKYLTSFIIERNTLKP
jgi:hypothetical protein